MQQALFTLGTVGFLSRCTVDGTFETGITESVESTLCNHDFLPVSGQIPQQFTGIFIHGSGTYRYGYNNITAAMTGTVGTASVLAASGDKLTFKAEINQGIEIIVRNQIYITAVTAVTAVRTALRYIFLSAETYAAVAAVTGFNLDMSFINKFHNALSLPFRRKKPNLSG